MKECTRCKQTLDASCFYIYKNKPVSRCKECTKKERKQFYSKNNVRVKERRKLYYEKNKDIILKKDSIYKKSPEAIEKRLKRYQDNIEQHREKDKQRYRKYWIKRRLSQIKSKCIKNNIYFDLTEEWVLKQINVQNNRCYWSGVEFDIDSILFRPSFDRVEAGGDYSKDNVVLSTYFVNMGRNNASAEELMTMIDVIKHTNPV